MRSRDSDNVRSCGTAQLGQTCKIFHNFKKKLTKSRTIVNKNVEIAIKHVFFTISQFRDIYLALFRYLLQFSETI